MNVDFKKKIEIFFKSKNFDEIIRLYNLNPEIFEKNIFLLEAACLSFFNLNKKKDAELLSRKIILINPGHLGAYHVLARVMTDVDIDKTLKYYKKLLDLSNNSINYLTEYLGLLFSLGMYSEPIQKLKDLIKKNPSNISFKINLAKVYIENHDFDEAVTVLKKELDNRERISVKDFDLLSIIANAHHNKGDYDLAKKTYEDCLKIVSNDTQTLLNLAVLEQEFGNFDKARVILDKINKLKKNAEAYRLIASSKKFKDKEDLDIIEMLALNSSSAISNIERSSLSFGLGKSYEDIKDYSESAKYYLIGNECRRKEFKNYNFNKELKIFSDLENIFDEKFYKKYSNISELGENMIFIVGMPRSGTTLLEQILSSHKNIYGAGELNYFSQSIDNVLKVYEFSNFKNEILKSDNKKIIDIGNYYNSKIIKNIKNTEQKNFIIDKNPINFKYVPLIFAALPKAKIIHIQRNQNDNTLSIYKNFFYHNVMPWSYSQPELKKYYSIYKSYMFKIQNNIQDSVYQLNYEDLIADTERQIKKLLDFVNVEWDDKCLKFYENKKSVRTASINQVRQKIYKTSENQWMNYKNYFKDLFV